MSDMDIEQVLSYLPHRFPFLLVDRVLECIPDKSIVGLKNVTINEPFFNGHFPGYPVMPGVLIIEALAQVAGILSFKSLGERPEDGALYLFVGIDDARFKAQVKPGDQLLLRVDILRRWRNIWKYQAAAYVGDTLVAEAKLMCAKQVQQDS